MTHPLLTFGHGRLDSEELGALIAGAGIAEVVDVRRFPGSRTNEAAARGAVPELCESLGIAYRWDERLGGRRRMTKDELEQSPDQWWQVAQFRAYAGWTRSEEFQEGLAELIAGMRERAVAVMCSEAVWWRCNRRIIADVAMLQEDLPVLHLLHSGDQKPAEPSDGARIGEDGLVVWDGTASD